MAVQCKQFMVYMYVHNIYDFTVHCTGLYCTKYSVVEKSSWFHNKVYVFIMYIGHMGHWFLHFCTVTMSAHIRPVHCTWHIQCSLHIFLLVCAVHTLYNCILHIIYSFVLRVHCTCECCIHHTCFYCKSSAHIIFCTL